METLKKADDAYLKACLVANDEIFLFLVMYTVRQYFRLLSPTQVAEVSGELVGQILFDVVVGLIITGGAGLAAKYGVRIGSKAVAGAMNVADGARTNKNILGEFLGQFAREFQDFMEDIGTNHRAIQVAGGSRLNPSSTQPGPDVRNRNAMYQQIADDDEVVNLQAVIMLPPVRPARLWSGMIHHPLKPIRAGSRRTMNPRKAWKTRSARLLVKRCLS